MGVELLKSVVSRVLRRRGFSKYFAPRVYDFLRKDFMCGARLGFSRRLWAYRNGFLGDTVVNYGLNPANVGDYVPDLTYLKLHPLNGPWSKLIDDKLTMRYVLAPFAAHLPKYYYHLHAGRVWRLMDCPSGLSSDFAGVESLLQHERQLAMKPIGGSGGQGFYKIARMEDSILLNDRSVAPSDFPRFLGECRSHVITEYLTPHPSLRAIYPKTANTVRVCTIRESDQRPEIIGAFVRFGTPGTGSVDNVVAGGIVSGVRVEDGTLFGAGTYRGAEFVELDKHPDTGVPVQGQLPYWEKIKGVLLEIGEYMPQLPYMGFDVVITDESFKVIEINSHPSSHVFQQYYPMLRTAASRRFFVAAMQAKGIKAFSA